MDPSTLSERDLINQIKIMIVRYTIVFAANSIIVGGQSLKRGKKLFPRKKSLSHPNDRTPHGTGKANLVGKLSKGIPMVGI